MDGHCCGTENRCEVHRLSHRYSGASTTGHHCGGGYEGIVMRGKDINLGFRQRYIACLWAFMISVFWRCIHSERLISMRLEFLSQAERPPNCYQPRVLMFGVFDQCWAHVISHGYWYINLSNTRG